MFDKFVAAALASLVAAFTASAADRDSSTAPRTELNNHERKAFIRRAQVWTPTDVARMNLRDGPTGPGALQPNQLVVCEHVDHDMPGNTPKFYCAIRPNDVVKVRYGEHNGELPGSVLATRLLWALGFAADRVYPVRVQCRGCTGDPWNERKRVDEINEFNPAVIERPPQGHEMRSGRKKSGWAWPELDDVDEEEGGAPREQRDALKLLAVFMQHGDTKPEQQRLLCLPGGLAGAGLCTKPVMMLHDVGLTFGKANLFNRNKTGSANLDLWAKTPVWRKPEKCIGHLSETKTGTLDDPHISEAGRRFLANLLVKLSDRQLYDLFSVARVDRVNEWIAAFKEKRDEIVTARCPE